MIGYKVVRTLMSVKIEIMLNLGLPCCLSVRCLENVGTSELVLDTDSEGEGLGYEDHEDEEVEESLDSDSESEDAEDEGLTAEEEDPAAGDEGLAAGDGGLSIRFECLGLGGDETIAEGQQRAALFVETVMSEPLRLGYKALRRREIASREGQMPSVFEIGQGSGSVLEPERPERIPPSPEWSSGSLPISPAPSIVSSPISSPMISLTIPSLVASPATAKAAGFLTELGAQVKIQGGLIHDHTIQLGELSPGLFDRHKPLEFEVGDRVLLKVSLWKGVIRFRKKSKLAPSMHDTFHVSNLNKCLADANLHVPLDEIKVDKTLRFVKEPVEIMDREVKSLKHNKIIIVKVRWNSNHGPKFTWEPEDNMKAKYP
nr:putative reverse transcriptase domain-containing protein [Tanacetum cinerariifolium]